MKRSLILLSLCLISTVLLAEEQYPWDLVRDPKFHKAYFEMLGKRSHDKWLSTLSGPAEPATKVTILDAEYLFFHSCKAHECDSHNIVIIYSPTSGRIYGKLGEEGTMSTLGSPSREISAELDKLYNEEFVNLN